MIYNYNVDEQCETYEHLFFKCRITVNIWKKIINFFDCNIDLTRITYKDVLFGDFNNSSENDINVLLLHYKYYLYLCKCKNQVPSLLSFLSLLKSEMKIAAYCAINNDKYSFFAKNGKL